MNPENAPDNKDRRSAERIGVNAEIEWATNGVRYPGTLGDVSIGGCYVLSDHEILGGEVVRLYFPLSDGKQIEILGETIDPVPEIGFSVRFMGLSETQKEFLESFAEVHQRPKD